MLMWAARFPGSTIHSQEQGFRDTDALIRLVRWIQIRNHMPISATRKGKRGEGQAKSHCRNRRILNAWQTNLWVATVLFNGSAKYDGVSGMSARGGWSAIGLEKEMKPMPWEHKSEHLKGKLNDLHANYSPGDIGG
jgi:hypothetical protein